jgi:ribonuclease HII
VTRSVPTLEFERTLVATGEADVVIAIDEVGRGALAGPVTLGAVLVDGQTADAPAGVRDSKQLSARQREALAPRVRSWAIAAEVVDISATRIDEIGIMRALGEGAAQAAALVVRVCAPRNPVVILDGRYDFLTQVDASWRVRTVVKGDATCASIAAASIIAKVHRDAVMRSMHTDLPEYGWDRNVGYATAAHRAALRDVGVSPHHRRSWRLLEEPTLDL